MAKRIGVFVCHCGVNIAGTVDVARVVREIANYPGVVFAVDYQYMCSDPGQNLIKKAIEEKNLDGVVVAACSPSMHEETFRNVCKQYFNEYRCEMANIREHCSWVHEGEEATNKAIKIIKAMIEKLKENEDLEPILVPVEKKCLVIGGGIAGIQSALDIADAGYNVILVEKEPSIGGRMAQLSETFPTLDCSQCILTPKMVAVARHPKIKLLTYSEVIDISGYVGNFHVKILKKPRYVDEDKCTVCGDCEKVCPVIVPNEFEMGRKPRKAIYIPFPQAVPSTYTLDIKNCLGLNPLICGKCKDKCEAKAIDYDMKEQIIEEDVGAIIVATGYDLYDKNKLIEYGYGEDEDIITSIEFERMLSANGPTKGEIIKPSNGREAKKVVFIQCAGSRDEQHMPYCSSICCMYTAKHALLYKHHVPDGDAYIFYIDIRAGGKGYEEFVSRVMKEERINYIRGKVAKIYREGDKLVVCGVDTLTGRKVEVKADLVVLALAILGKNEIAKKLRVAVDEGGFFKESHPKLKPVESLSRGIYFAGCCQSPKDIPSAVAQASASASKVLGLISRDRLEKDPLIAFVDENCSGCGICISVCPYGALVKEGGKAKCIPALCEGCGTCSAACPSNNIEMKNYRDKQIEKMIEVII
ncbi:MAG: CoB--CoM heterodisulfide reductase iron-sulfur subunit A family protein [Thermoplasmatales archaeon]|nr:CoB--CoM heterodisulfide reductase iron-sulfur subunit A family protein [Thermoplasmatales archaeon]